MITMFNLHFIEEVYGLSKIFLSWNEVGWVFSYISFSRKRWYKGELPWQQMYILDDTGIIHSIYIYGHVKVCDKRFSGLEMSGWLLFDVK